MTFANIRLQNFRSYNDQAFEFEHGVNIIVGPNASGKTNLLEAILITARGATYKTTKPNELIKHKKQWARLDVIGDDSNSRTVKLERKNDNQKQFIINGESKTKLSIKHKVPTVLFEPAQLYLLTTSPEARRSFVDDLLEQTIPEFKTIKNAYQRTLRQRNSLLKQPNKTHVRSNIFAWNIRLSETGSLYIQHRLALLKKLNKTVTKRYNHIADSKHRLKLSYASNIKGPNYADDALKKLEAAVDVDIARGFTTTGPHRDDIKIHIDTFELRETASRGEVRTTLLALKLSEADLIEQTTNKKPLFLLDDVFGELDGKRRHALTDYIKNYQAFITTTDADLIQKNFVQKANIISLSK